VDAGVF